MDASYHRHDINDKVWELLEPHLPGQRGQWGGIAQDNRRFINAVFWVLRTGAPWRDLPPDYGKWGSVHQRFIRWRRKGVWEKLLEILIDEPDCEWLMIDFYSNNSDFNFSSSRSAIGVKIWYFFQIKYIFVSSFGVRGRKTSPLSGFVSIKCSKVKR